ncbi:MAG TPA: zinc-dependent metalloprotease [Chitinophagaceae bacterium]
MKNFFKSGLMVLLLCSALIAKSQVPVYNSYPAASAVIFLDFDGHNVTGTNWNYMPVIQCGASGLDGTQITEIFNRVAEDYRPFNINVTTDSTKYWAAPATKRMRVILTVSSEWYGSAGGVAFVNSFGWGNNTPAFVFTALLGYTIKSIAEAASHEAGHTLGLYHQARWDENCIKLSDYHSGTGSGEIGWAPIMGVGYYRNLTLWHNGSNSYGCNSTQSDLAVISSGQNGFGYRTDDHKSAFNQSTLTTFNGNIFNVNGVVETSGDQDAFKFTIPDVGRFELSAVPYNVGTGNSGSNLDLQIGLYNSSQSLLNTYNPGTLLNSVIDTVLNAGEYYLRVEGKGNQYAPSYASLGSYSLNGKFTAGGVLPLHKLELRGKLNGDKHQLNWDIIADEQVIEQIVEIATDGRNFTPLIQTANDSRSYMYKPGVTTAAQYRINVSFDDGHRYYSNVVTLKQTNAAPRPQLLGNIISNSSIKVTSPGSHFSYVIHDMSGRAISQGQLSNGTNIINAGRLINGMYMIRFTDEDQQWTDKLIKQ